MMPIEYSFTYGREGNTSLEFGYDDNYFTFIQEGERIRIENIPEGTHTIHVDTLFRTVRITSETSFKMVDIPDKVKAPKNKPYYRNLNPRKRQW